MIRIWQRFDVSLLKGKSATILILMVMFFVCLISVDWSELSPHGGGRSSIWTILSGFTTLDLSREFMLIALESTWITVTYSFCAISIALVIGIIGGLLASGTIFESWLGKLAGVVGFRVVLALIRSIHELIWAWFIAIVLGFTPISGVIALAIPYGAIIARVFADFLNDVPEAPLRSLRSSGAGPIKILIYGRIPLASRDMVSYGFYRFECCVRSAAVLSFIGLPGIGYQIAVSLEDLNFGQVWPLLLFLVGLVVSVDYWGSRVRRNMME